MTGWVDANLEARLALRLRGPSGEEEVETVIDTGFTDYLLVSSAMLERLGTAIDGQTEAILGDGSEVQFDIHPVEVLWGVEWRTVRAFAGEGGALVGVSLLAGCRLTIDFLPGGEARIEAV